jgi:lipoprotein-anchoring transpeptidase ErfK/SrfK
MTPRGVVPSIGGTAPGRGHDRLRRRVSAALLAAVVVGATWALAACEDPGDEPARVLERAGTLAEDDTTAAVGRAFDDGARAADSLAAATRADSVRRARADSLRAARDPRLIHAAALDATGLRILVSLDDRRLLVLDGPDTVRVAPVGIGMDSTLVYRGRVWNFRTPRGLRHVRSKEAEPVWVPPEWHYVEVAKARGLRLVTLRPDHPVVLDDGSRVVVQDDEVGLVRPDVPFTPFAHDEEVIWEGTLYIPPIGTKQRRVTGELGPYRLDLGDGYLLHGTPHAESIGEPSSHGCMRLGDDDITWLYVNVPVGTPVYTY